MSVGRICHREVVTIGPGDSLNAAARLMRERHVGFLVVVETVAPGPDRQAIGVLTDRDIVTTVIAKEADPSSLTVADVMTRNPLLVSESQTLTVTLRHMREVGVRRVPIIGARGELVGVLSLDDVLQEIAERLSDVAGAVRSEQRLERTTRT